MKVKAGDGKKFRLVKIGLDGEVTDAQFLRLRELRAAKGQHCSCHISPPCSVCVEPITQEEADELNGEDDESQME